MENKQIMHDLTGSRNSFPVSKLFLFLIVAIVVGVLAGFLFSKSKTSSNTTADATNVEKTAGISDKKTFKDKAEGILKEGGMEGEGNFHLERPGGASQNVYLTSTTVDLSLYIDKKVRVWGVTFNSQKAGWLMDVGLVELLK